MALTGKLTISGRTFEIMSPSDDKKLVSELLKDNAYQVLHEENLDKCKGWKWATNQSHKIRQRLDKAVIVWY